jgi:hypothetical protein
MASKTNDFVGTFATSTLADAYIASKGWTVQVGWVFLDSTNVVLSNGCRRQHY